MRQRVGECTFWERLSPDWRVFLKRETPIGRLAFPGWARWERGARKVKGTQAEQVAEKVFNSVIPSEARNLSSLYTTKKKERFLASLGSPRTFSVNGMAGGRSGGLFPQPVKPVRQLDSERASG